MRSVGLALWTRFPFSTPRCRLRLRSSHAALAGHRRLEATAEAVILAHYYQKAPIQDVADFTAIPELSDRR